jgi:hypothetical protein
MTNNQWTFTFNYATTNSLISPWMTNSVGPGATATLVLPATSGNCRLYYRSLKFKPGLNQDIVNKLTQGFTKKVPFRCSDFYPGARAQTTEPISATIATATVNPIRIWCLGSPAGGLNGQGSDTVNGSFVFPMRLSGFNAIIQNVPYYARNLDSPAEQWDVLKQQFPSNSNEMSGPQLTYSDFYNSYRLNVIDCQRLKERLANPNGNVGIQIVATRDAAYQESVDINYVVERECLAIFDFNGTQTKVVISQNVHE